MWKFPSVLRGPWAGACLLTLAGMAWAGCGDDNGWYGAGSYCLGDRDCPLGARCEHKVSGEGECLLECRDDRQCPQGWGCTDSHGGTCHVPCATDWDCPAYLECKLKKAKSGGGEYRVCD